MSYMINRLETSDEELESTSSDDDLEKTSLGLYTLEKNTDELYFPETLISCVIVTFIFVGILVTTLIIYVIFAVVNGDIVY